MHRPLSPPRALGSRLLFLAASLAACTEERPKLFGDPDAGSYGGSGSAGRGGSAQGGSAGRFSGGDGGTAGSSVGGSGAALGDAGVDAEADAGGCSADSSCDDANVCTADTCEGGKCVHAPVAAGTACGSDVAGECTLPDSCDAEGVCQPNHVAPGTACGSDIDDACTDADTCNSAGACAPNHAVLGTACGDATENACTRADVCDGQGACSPNHVAAGTPCGSDVDAECSNPDSCDGLGACLSNDADNGAACTDGSCTVGECIAGQPEGCPVDVAASVPFDVNWSSVGRVDLYDGACDSQGTPDYALLFTAPETGTFRFSAAGFADSTPDGVGEDADSVMTIVPDGCATAEVQIACNDDVDASSRNSQLDVALTAGQQVTVLLNELGETGGGTGSLSIVLLPP